MEDWKGTKIEVGHTIKIYHFMNMFGGLKMRFLSLHRNSTKELLPETKIPYDFKWDLIGTYKIVNTGGTVFSLQEVSPKEERKLNYELIDSIISIQSSQALCIEGVSDNRDDFMLDYFNK